MTDNISEASVTARVGRPMSAPLVVGLGAFAVAAAIALAGRSAGIPLDDLIRDPAAQFGYPAHGGLISHLGVLVLAATAAITGFAAALLRGEAVGRLLWGAALLSAILTADDLFLLHENLDGARQAIAFAVYGLAVLGLAIYARHQVSDLDLSGLFVVLGFLGASAIIDMTAWRGPMKSALEDFSKLAGFAAWLTFWIGTARMAIGARVRR